MEMTTKKNNDLANTPLGNTPLEKWAGEDLMKMSARAARLWNGEGWLNPQIAPGNLMTDRDDLAQEICLRILTRLKKDKFDPNENQESRFFRIAKYMKKGIMQDNFSPETNSIYNATGDEIDEINLIDFIEDDRRDPVDEEESGAKIRGLLEKIGLRGRQMDAIASIFDSSNKDLINATGLSESSLKSQRRQILADIKQKIKKAGLVNEFEDALAAFVRARSDITKISVQKGEKEVEMTLSHYSRITIF